MRTYAIGLVLFYLLAKTYVRLWFYKPIQNRPGATRQNEALRFIDFAALLALMAAFFLFLNMGRAKFAVAVVIAAVLYDLTIRYLFIQWEVSVLLRRSPKLSGAEARTRIRRRARATMFR